MVVDDSKAMRQFIVYTLSQNQHNVMEAYDDRTAMKFVGNADVDIVVTDKNMPGMDGIELTKLL